MTRSWDEQDSHSTGRAAARDSPTCSSARPSTARSSPARKAGWTRFRRTPAHGQVRAPSYEHTREPDWRPPLRQAPGEIVRIYSTSGTTSSTSYVPLTASDLDNWVTGSARSYAAARRSTPGQRIVSTYNGRALRRGRGARGSFDRIGLCHIPVGIGKHRTPAGLRSSALRPEAAVLTPSYAAHLVECGGRPRRSTFRRSSCRARPRRRRAGRRPAGVFRARARGAPGARGDRGDGHRRHRRLAAGRVRGAGRHAPRRPRLRARRSSIDPETEKPAARSRTARPRASSSSRISSHRAAPATCCASARATTSRSGPAPCACGRTAPRGPLPRADRRHADRPRRERLPGSRARGRGRLRARGQRPHPREAAHAWREAGASAPGHGRARAGPRGGRGARGGDRREAPRGTRRPGAGRAGALGEPRPQRVQSRRCSSASGLQRSATFQTRLWPS